MWVQNKVLPYFHSSQKISVGFPVRFQGLPRTEKWASPYKSMGFPVLLIRKQENKRTREVMSRQSATVDFSFAQLAAIKRPGTHG